MPWLVKHFLIQYFQMMFSLILYSQGLLLQSQNCHLVVRLWRWEPIVTMRLHLSGGGQPETYSLWKLSSGGWKNNANG